MNDGSLNPVAKVLHPQIEMSTVSRALEIEKEYLRDVHEYFGLGSFETLRFDTSVGRHSTHEVFK